MELVSLSPMDWGGLRFWRKTHRLCVAIKQGVAWTSDRPYDTFKHNPIINRGEPKMIIEGIIEEIFDKYAIVVFEDYNNVSFWFDIKDLPEDAREDDIIDIDVPDDFVIPTEHSLKEPYDSDGLLKGIRIDHEENKRRTEAIHQMLREFGHWNL
jgi:hypothetical protein